MTYVDWIVLSVTLLFIILYGTWKTRKIKDSDTYLRGDKATKWWTIGLSVMATQASAITFLSTPGQAYHDGMSFVQFYFGLPIAVIIICLVFIPIYHRLNIYTAYEFLENRFDLKTRMLTAILFLIQRGLAAGITIFAPAIILSAVLGWSLKLLIIIIGTSVIIYTVSGGTKAVNITQKQQILVIMMGMFIAFYMIFQGLPSDMGFFEMLTQAGNNGKLNILDFSFNTKSRYTFWSGITGGLFLALSYFGTDQSQVQRYLSGKSMKEKQLGLIFNGFLKIPMQFFILLTGVALFIFYQYNQAPLHFNPVAEKVVLESNSADAYKILQEEYNQVFDIRQSNQLSSEEIRQNHKHEKEIRERAKTLIRKVDSSIETNDKDYVFIYYVLKYLPQGLVGLLIAVILSAAMSSTASELNALGTTTTVDLYKTMVKRDYSEAHYVKMLKIFTLIWGIIAIFFANFGALFENLIQLVNIIGSIFYGNVLGIFLIAFFIKFIKGHAVFYAALITQVFIILLYYFAIHSQESPALGYLWLNAIGCIAVIVLATLLQLLERTKKQAI